ncbi:hypothetical protein ATANTOWER_027182 [Ataeniobius toweri]|uniref:Uncharacterized protein n=1 Tax=Ataeniobius toweri TaxID=208326 RepID=A0ABU7C510_9TELE|nr:hypothetical protein [Ataeniobius toweri]
MAPFPSSQLRASGKCLKNSSNPPTKHRRGRPAFTPAPAAASPGFCSGSPPISSSSSSPAIPQSSLLYSSRTWILSSAHYHPLLSFSGSSPPILPRQHFLFFAPPTFNLLLGPSH